MDRNANALWHLVARVFVNTRYVLATRRPKLERVSLAIGVEAVSRSNRSELHGRAGSIAGGGVEGLKSEVLGIVFEWVRVSLHLEFGSEGPT